MFITARIIAYLISHPQFNIWNTSYITSHSFLTGSLETTIDQLPKSVASLAQLVRVLHRYCKFTGLNPVEVLNFSGCYILNCINCVHNRKDHSLLDFISAVQYNNSIISFLQFNIMKYFIYHFTDDDLVVQSKSSDWKFSGILCSIYCENSHLHWIQEFLGKH